jgi:hypothetical protein
VSLLRRSLPLLLTILLAACQGSNSHPVPSVSQIGADLKCAPGDHPHEDFQAGWGFCYPGTWHYIEKAQAVASPPGLDLTFDITDIPCASPAAGSTSSTPVCSPNAGLFAFMIISTYERGDSGSLAAWVQTNLVSPPSTTPTASPSASPSASPLVLQPIAWGDATEAARLPDGRRIALTQHHVVILDLHSSSGHLDLEHEMSSRLDTWKFSY